MPIVRPDKEQAEREVAMMEWGMVPRFSRTAHGSGTPSTLHSETVRTSATCKGPFLKQRCVVPATGYIEFSGPKSGKVAHLLHPNRWSPIALAGRGSAGASHQRERGALTKVSMR